LEGDQRHLQQVQGPYPLTVRARQTIISGGGQGLP